MFLLYSPPWFSGGLLSSFDQACTSQGRFLILLKFFFLSFNTYILFLIKKNDNDQNAYRKAWMEEGTTSWRCVAEGSYSALFFSVGEKFNLVFLEGRGYLRSWKACAKKFSSLGICPQKFE